MQKFDSSVKIALNEIKEKRSKRFRPWKNFQKLTSAANLRRVARPTGIETEASKGLRNAEQLAQSLKHENKFSDTLAKDHTRDENLNNMSENASWNDGFNKNKKMVCILDDVLLQNEVRGVVNRLQALLKLSGNSAKPFRDCARPHASGPILHTNINKATESLPFSIFWDASSNSLSIKLLPAADSAVINLGQNHNSKPKHTCALLSTCHLKRFILPLTPFPFSSVSPTTPRRLLSSRNSTDSGFFSRLFFTNHYELFKQLLANKLLI